MPIRKRTITDQQLKGYYYRNGVWFGNATNKQITARHYCEDEIGTRTDLGPLLIQHQEMLGGRINQPGPTTGLGSSFWNYLCDGAAFPSHLSIPQSPSDTIAATEAAARTNPSKPHVDVPVALLELGDIVKLLQKMGNSLIRNAGNTFINYNFGVKPIVDDLFKLTEFDDQVNRRIGQLKRLEGPRGLRRTVVISSNSAAELNPNFVWQSSGVYVVGPRHHTTSEEVKAHCRWGISPDYPAMTGDERMALVKRALLGGTVDFSTLWELLPWSWLIDWGSNMGQFFAAQRNIVPATLHSIHIMRHRKSEYSGRPVAFSNVKFGGFSSKTEEKRRSGNIPVFPTARLPFLNGTQMGILASLAVTRR